MDARVIGALFDAVGGDDRKKKRRLEADVSLIKRAEKSVNDLISKLFYEQRR